MSASPTPPPRISEIAPRFLDHARVELQFGAQTLEKYEYCLRRIVALISSMGTNARLHCSVLMDLRSLRSPVL